MRNLKLKFSRQITSSILNVKFLLQNADIFYLVTATKVYAKQFGKSGTEELLDLVDIVGAEYLVLENEICLATEAGEVVILQPKTRVLNECTYCIEGLTCMSWSPDQEVAIFITKEQKVVVMTSSYDVVKEHTLSDNLEGALRFMNVGWGSKETQFHGSAGKSGAELQNDFLIQNENDLHKEILVSWREDSAYFAISMLSAEARRMFKVFDKEGILQYCSEPLNNLYYPLSWRPSGTWLAMPQRLPQKSIIALFEKNGLRHREIVLPFSLSEEPIISLKWSLDSDILAVETKILETAKQNLYLYTMSNYNWYVKQLLSFELPDAISVYKWDTLAPKTLNVILQSGLIFTYSWQFVIDKFERSGIVVVINDRKLHFTNFRNGVLPPPMCHEEQEFDVTINAVSFSSNNIADSGPPVLFVYDANQNLHVLTAERDSSLKFVRQATLKSTTELLKYYLFGLGNFCCFNKKFLIATKTFNGATKLLLIAIKTDEKVFTIANSLPVSENIIALNCAEPICYAQTVEGEVLKYYVNKTKKLEIHVQLPHVANNLEWYCSQNSESNGLIALCTNQDLYIDDQFIAKDVSSYCLVSTNYLAFTQISELCFLRLSDRRIVANRRIECGGKLITTIENSSRLILQMPRGNLEAINPRILVLEKMADLLRARHYNAAVEMLRKERINLNIICDHNLTDFVENMDSFLDEIQNTNWLNLFISDLKNEDFTQSIYASNYNTGAQCYPKGFIITEKVNYLCRKLCDHMELRSGDERFRLPIVTAYVKLGKIEKALELIWRQKRDECSNVDKQGLNRSADETLKYLLYLVDVNELYNVALGTYDFGLVLFVAQKSQKDPKEFLPFLNEMKDSEISYRKFKIDELLKRYEKALQHIAQCGNEKFGEALEFIKRHRLFQLALKCYKMKSETECYNQICLLFADHLRANGELENASLMYERGGNSMQALLSAKHTLDWRRVLALASQDGQQIKSVALSLVGPLQDNGKFDVAFQLLKKYDDDFVGALQCLVRGRHFLDAIYEAQMYQGRICDTDLIVSVITPALLSYREILEKTMQSDLTTFLNHKKRLLDLRESEKVLNRSTLEVEDGKDECDLFSDSSSMPSSRYTGITQGSSKTFSSSKSRRKQERKLLSLKPGNPFEYIALIDALHNLITRIASKDQQMHMRSTCKSLLELQHDSAAYTLQQQYKLLLAVLQDSLDEIWIPEIMITQHCLKDTNIGYKQLQKEQRFALLDPQKRYKPQLTIMSWEHEILR